MKKLLFALALTSFAAGTAFATDGDKADKNAKKAAAAKKECSAEAKSHCSKEMAAAKPGCCAAKNKTAALITPKPVAASAASAAEVAK